MAYIGSWKIDDLVTFTCNTHTPSTGAATDADSPPTYRVYEDETATPILTGTMALLDSANTAGFYSEQITLSAANGFEKGKSYNVYITGTVGGIAGTMHHTLQLEAEVDANRLNWANIDNPATAQNLSATNIDVDQVVASVTAGVTVTTNNDKTGYALSGAGVLAVQSGLSTLTTAQVNAEVLDVLTVDTFAEVTSAPAATSSLKDKIGWVFKLARNLRKTTSTTDSVYDDAGAVVTSTSTISDDGTTFTRGEYT